MESLSNLLVVMLPFLVITATILYSLMFADIAILEGESDTRSMEKLANISYGAAIFATILLSIFHVEEIINIVPTWIMLIFPGALLQWVNIIKFNRFEEDRPYLM